MRQLSFHSSYRCHESGACCTAGWPIPIEADRMAAVELAMSQGLLSQARPSPLTFIRPADAAADAPALIATSLGGCVFHQNHGQDRCNIQRTLGHAALPLACRQFPRVTVVDPLGVSTTLSHFCPTAARLLEFSGPTMIVTMPMIDADEALSDLGLDVRDQLPPLLRPEMLMTWEAWRLFEHRAVLLIEHAPDAATALARLRTAVDRLHSWSPGDEPLEIRIKRAFVSPTATETTGPSPAEHLEAVLAAVPDTFRPGKIGLKGQKPEPDVRRRFLAAHAFANWTIHLGQGVRAWLHSLEAVDGLISAGLGVREVDLLIRHQADPRMLAETWSRAESA